MRLQRGVGFDGNLEPIRAARVRLRKLSGKGALQIYERVDLRAWSSLGVGGPADLLIRCDNESAAQDALDILATFGLSWYVLGAGSSLVFADEGIRVPVISLGGELATWELDLDGVVVGARANVIQVRNALIRSGLEPPPGLGVLPGSLAGWLNRWIGTHDTDRLVGWMRLLRPGVAPTMVPFEDLAQHEGLGGVRSPVAVRARLELAALTSVQNGSVGLRRESPSLSRGGGGASQRPVFEPVAGVKIENMLGESGCADLVVGTARPARHSLNSVMTTANARADDVKLLCREMRDRVQNRFGVELQSAFRFVDEYGDSSAI